MRLILLNVLVLSSLMNISNIYSDDDNVERACCFDCFRPQDWPMFGRDRCNTANNPVEKLIDKTNIDKLTRLWRFSCPTVSNAPIIDHCVVYFEAYDGVLHALNALTGDEIWNIDLNPGPGLGRERYSSPLVLNNLVYIGSNTPATAFAINKYTGAIEWSTALDTNNFSQVTSSPMYAEGRVFFATDTTEGTQPPPLGGYTFRGAVFALNHLTGQQIWRYELNQGFGSGVGVKRSSPGLDTERGYLYVGTGSATAAPAGPQSDALIALDYRTTNPAGQLVWLQQFTANDVMSVIQQSFNFDVAGNPNLFTVNGNDYVGVNEGSGTYVVCDRDTGDIIWRKHIIPQNEIPATVSGPSSALARVKHDADKILAVITASNYDPENVFPPSVLIAALQGNFPAVQAGVRGVTTLMRTQVTARKAHDGKKLWFRDFEGASAGQVIVANDIVYFTTYHGFVYGLDVHSGETLWELEEQEIVNIFGVPDLHLPLTSSPTIDNILYFGRGLEIFTGGVDAYTLPKLFPPLCALD